MDSFLEQEEEEAAAKSPAAQAGSALLPALHLPFLPPHLYQPASSREHKLNFKKSKEVCLSYIQDAMLQKQWKRAAEFLTFYIESLEKDFSTEYMGPSEMIWRIGTEILCHHSHSSMKEFNSFIEQMKTLGVKRYLKVCLEHAFHLLCNGLIDEAYQNLSLAESWRFGEQTAIQDKEMKLIQAYRGLLDYYSWSKQKTILLEHEKRKKRRLGLEVIFAALDYAGWKENVKAWSCLARQVKQIVISEKHLDWIKQEWNSRKDWWPAFHFSRYLAKRNWQENESLSYEKALVAGILLGKDCKYFKYVSHQGCKAQVKRFRILKKFVNKHNPVYLRISGLSDSSVQP